MSAGNEREFIDCLQAKEGRGCSYCGNKEAAKCPVCNSFACSEHMIFVRRGRVLTPVCIACYEAARGAYYSEK
ncbi:unnamed protein product, partial [marine sediment metagenome]